MDVDESFKQTCEEEDKVIYQHQEGPNEEYFECEAEYLEGTWCQ